DEILRGGPASGRAARAGRRPAASSDSAAAAIGGTAYVIGGYTGTHWLDTIVAWRPGGVAHVVAHLPATLRYAAVTAVGGRLVVAGGSLENGTASDAVLEYVPGAKRVVRIGRLPAPTTHAAAATLDGVAYVIGGRGAALDSPTTRVVSVDPRTHRVRPVGDPYNMYCTPNGKYAIVVAERLRRLDFRNARTFALHKSLYLPCIGPDHMDFSARGDFALVSCEFSGELVKVDVARERVVGR